MASRIKRLAAVTISDVLDGHVQLDLDCLDRLYLHGYLPQEAFALLRRVSQNTNRKVRLISADLVQGRVDRQKFRPARGK